VGPFNDIDGMLHGNIIDWLLAASKPWQVSRGK
jgi:hypothetical protein